MLNLYNRTVTPEQLNSSPRPSNHDTILLSQALGIALKVGVPLPNATAAVTVITPNAHLRHYLDQASEKVVQGEGISETFTNAPYIFAMPVFLSAFVLGEGIERLADTCLLYAHGMGIQPGALANQIAYDESTRAFTAHMAEELTKGACILKSLRVLPTSLTIKSEIIEDVESGSILSQSLSRQFEVFGPLYIAMIRFAERNRNNQELAQTFSLLANS